MIKELNLKEVGRMLPHGSVRKIANATGINYTDVARMFKGFENDKTPIVINATRAYLTELRPVVESVYNSL